MKQLALLLFFVNFLSALNFEPCFQKNSLAMYKIAGIPAIGINEKQLLLVTNDLPEEIPNYKLLKKNNFLGLHLVESQKRHDYIKLIDTDRAITADEVAVITKEGFSVGKILKREQAFDFAQFSKNTPKGSVIGIKCYSAVGIGVGGNSFVESKYIKYFVESDPFVYGDIGIRFKKNDNAPIAYLVDPYRKNLNIKVGDKILKVNGTDIISAGQIKDLILFSKPGTKMNLLLERDGKKVEVITEVDKLLGDSYEAETFLERFGVIFNKNLIVSRVLADSQAVEKKLRVGDRLIQIDRQKVTQSEEITKILSDTKSTTSTFLFERSGLQFFIKLP